MIYVTGDTHIPMDIHKLDVDCFPEQLEMTKSDYIIICGDFGGVWNGSRKELDWREWLDSRNFTTLFVDGNHENFELLNSYPIEEWNGGKIHRISSSIIHLMRAQVFNLQGLSFFTMGGGYSIDRQYRLPGYSWWPEEMPSAQEYEEAWINLEKRCFSVDYIISHAAPECFMSLVPIRYSEEKELNCFLEDVKSKTCYRHWFFGHLHKDRTLDDKHTALYMNTICIQS